jgi:predicted PurR-regulated permease PerM
MESLIWIIGCVLAIGVVGLILFILVAQVLGGIRDFFVNNIKEANGSKNITDLYEELHSIKWYLKEIHEEQIKQNKKNQDRF